MLSDEQVKNIMFDVERSKNVFQYQIGGISIYYLLRFLIESDLRIEAVAQERVEKKNIFTRLLNKVKYEIKNSKKQKRVKAFSRQFDNPGSILESPLLFISCSNYRNEEGIGPHLIDIVEHYSKQGHIINFIQRKYFSSPAFPERSQCYNRFLPLDIDSSDKLPPSVYTELGDLLKIISEKTKIDFVPKLKNYYLALIRIVNESNALADYIVRSKAQYVFSYSIYTEPSVIVACRKANVKLIEVQHGVMLPDTIYYQSALGDSALEKGYLLMPDYILTLGSEWRDILINQQSYYSAGNTIVLGSTGFDVWKKFSKLKPEKISSPLCIVFFSQGRSYNNINSIHNFIENFIDTYAPDIKRLGVQIILRPHPNDTEEFISLESKYLGLVTVENPSTVSSLKSIMRADMIFAASSMCLYEAISFGRVAISLTRFSGIIRKEHIHSVQSIEELFEVILQYNDNPHSPLPTPYLEGFNPGVLDKLINQEK